MEIVNSAVGIEDADGGEAALVSEIIEGRRLHAVLQPIIGLGNRDIVGFEGLIRGPEDGPLHLPLALFAAAERAGLRVEIEELAQQVAAETFVSVGCPGKLFLNVTPQAFTQSSAQSLPDFLRHIGLAPHRVIIELTENEPTRNFPMMRRVMGHFRGLGFEVAIDDLGEGFASLRLWSELHPEYVKLDMHFVQGVSQESLKFQFVKAIQQIAESCGTRVIAEGIETHADLRVIRDLGIAYAQGYYIARPSRVPEFAISQEARQSLSTQEISVYPQFGFTPNRNVTARRLLLEIAPVTPETPNDDVYRRFEQDPGLEALPVVSEGRAVGLINRHELLERFARPFQRELYGRRPCAMVMDPEPLVIDADVAVQELSSRVVEAERRHLANGFILVSAGLYAGMATSHDLIREITQMQLVAARYANPLTLLPGNVPIAEHLSRLLQSATEFHACHCDLDNFKPFNDVFGYQRGDEIILLAARVLSATCAAGRDFIGHIGGDDFLMLLQSDDWEPRCESALAGFAAGMTVLLNDDERAAQGYSSEDRRGEQTFYPFPTLSIGVVGVSPEALAAHLDISAAAADAKKQAKRLAGNSLFIERRKLFSDA